MYVGRKLHPLGAYRILEEKNYPLQFQYIRIQLKLILNLINSPYTLSLIQLQHYSYKYTLKQKIIQLIVLLAFQIIKIQSLSFFYNVVILCSSLYKLFQTFRIHKIHLLVIILTYFASNYSLEISICTYLKKTRLKIRLRSLDLTREDLVAVAEKYLLKAVEGGQTSRVVFGSQNADFNGLETQGWKVQNPIDFLSYQYFDQWNNEVKQV